MVGIISAEEYFQFDAMNQSLLKSYSLGDPRMISKERPQSELFFEEKKYFVIGGAVDTILTSGVEEFKEKYHVSTIEKKPSDNIKSIINQVYANLVETALIVSVQDLKDKHCEDMLFVACVSHNYYDNIKDKDKKIAKVTSSPIALEYFKELRDAGTKTIIDVEEYNIILNVVQSLTTNPTTAKYFQTNQPDNIRIYNQFGITFRHKEVQCKALLDMVIINDTDKTITPVDLKTTSKNTYEFDKAVRERRYDIQAAWYTLALEELVKVDPNFMGYSILPFEFIAESTAYPGAPIVAVCDEELLRIGRYGVSPSYIGDMDGTVNESIATREIFGFEQLLDKYKYYEENGYKFSEKYIIKKGKFSLNWQKLN